MSKKKRTREFELRKDVLIQPEAATLTGFSPGIVHDGPPPWEDLYKDAQREARGLRKEKSELVDFASQMCSLTLVLAKMLVDAKHAQATHDRVTIPKALHEQMVGASISVGQDVLGNPFVEIKERGRERIHAAQ